jgi:hypothetical protein
MTTRSPVSTGRASLFSLLDAPPPDAAVEIASDRVTAVVVGERGGRAAVAAHASEPLPAGAVAPSLTAENIRDREGIAEALRSVLEQVGRPRRVGVILPDPIANVSLVRFEQVPARAADLDQLIRWQVRKAAPFAIDEAQVRYVDSGAGGGEFIVSVARRATVEEYERLCADAGAQPGLVDISTFNVINTVLASAEPPGSAVGSSPDWLLVNVAADWASIAILRGAQLIFFRTRSAESDGTLTDLVHQTAMYYEDRLQGGGFARALVCGGAAAAPDPSNTDDVRRRLEERLGMGVEPVDVRTAAALTDRIAAAPDLLDALAPGVGLLLGRRAVAA